MALNLTDKFNSLWDGTAKTTSIAGNAIQHTVALADQHAIDLLLEKHEENTKVHGINYMDKVQSVMNMYD